MSSCFLTIRLSSQCILVIPRDNWKTLLFRKVYCYHCFFSTTMFFLCLKQMIWKKSIFYFFISAITLQYLLIPKWSSHLSYLLYLILTSYIFSYQFYLIVHTFLHKWKGFKRLITSLEAYFSNTVFIFLQLVYVNKE